MSQQLKAVLLDTNTQLKTTSKRGRRDDLLETGSGIFAGCNPDYEDNWRDIGGYAVLEGIK